MPRIVSICDRSTVALQPWAERGWDCYAVNTDHRGYHEGSDGVVRIGCDARALSLDFIPDIVLAWPPCTMFAVSGTRLWRTRTAEQMETAISVAKACMNWVECASQGGMLENPVGRLKDYLGPASFMFHPHQYALYAEDPSSQRYTKATCIWNRRLVRPPKQGLSPNIENYILNMPKDRRAERRSVTPEGWARAVADFNSESEYQEETVSRLKDEVLDRFMCGESPLWSGEYVGLISRGNLTLEAEELARSLRQDGWQVAWVPDGTGELTLIISGDDLTEEWDSMVPISYEIR